MTAIRSRLNLWFGDLGGALADLGTFLPLVLGLIALNQFSPQGIFFGFGLFALLTAFFYRKPMPLQPMKVIAALVIAQGLTPSMMQASAMLMGAILLVLALTGAIQWLARQISQAVSVGIQLAIGLQLVMMGSLLILQSPTLGILALVLLLISHKLPMPYLAMPLVLGFGMLWQYHHGGSTIVTTQIPPWQLVWPTLNDWQSAAVLLVLPQLALTLTNAIIATSAMAKDLYPEEAARFSMKNLALTSGFANLLLAPFGAAAMCHGAGGLAVQRQFGARTIIAPLFFGSSCLLIALFWGDKIANVLGLIPMAALGALLIIAGGKLAWSKRFIDGKPFCLLVIIATAASCLIVNTAIGLVVGITLELGRRQWQVHTQ